MCIRDSKERFPGGLKEVMDYIRSKGMVPGVWLELEVMGIKCPKADKVPDDWYPTKLDIAIASVITLDIRPDVTLLHIVEITDSPYPRIWQ